MQKKQPVDNQSKKFLTDKRDELCWALALQDFRPVDIAAIFSIKHRSTIMRILARKPERWQPKWIKIDSNDVVGSLEKI